VVTTAVDDASAEPAETDSTVEARYVLLTECLQNDFFRNRSCSLCLPAHATRPMLYSQNALERQEAGVRPRRLRGRRKTPLGLHEIGPADAPELRAGPLATFLEMTVDITSRTGLGPRPDGLQDFPEDRERIDNVDFKALGRLGFDTESPAASNGSGAGAAQSADAPAQ
jgi:hypothetical protein